MKLILPRFSIVFMLLTLFIVGCKTVPDKSTFLKCRGEVKLVGTIKDEIFPGPPNYKDIGRGDEPEDYCILKLDAPIDVAEDPEYPVPDENSPHLNADYSANQQFLDKRVVVTGELTQGFTVHHKTAVLIDVRDIKLAEKRD